MKRATLALLLSSMAMAAIPVAQAEDTGDQVLKRVVDYSDLNLAQPNAAGALYVRLKDAARYVCSPYSRRGNEYYKAHRACMQTAVHSAVTKVGRAELTAWHQSRSGRIVSSSAQASVAMP
jgi:UrcA family protein